MKLRSAFGILIDLTYAVRVAFIPTVRGISREPSLLFHPVSISRLFMSHVWSFFGNVTNENSREIKNGLLPENAYGVVLDIGAGYGHTINYLDNDKVTKYVALEPNTHMHEEIRRNANVAGFSEDSGTLLILPYGAEEVALITSALQGPHTVDTMVSVLTLCTVPTPEKTIPALIDQILKPGGVLLYYEHVRNPLEDAAWWQRFWTPIWKVAFDGCCLDRPTDVILERLDVWEQKDIRGLEGEDPEHLFLHSIGKLKKTATVAVTV